MFYSPLQSMWDLTTHPPWGPASSLAHRPMSGSDTICKSQNPPLCPLWPVTYRRQPHDFKTCLQSRGFHTLIRNVLFLSPTDVGSHNPPPSGAQRPRWHTPDVWLYTLCKSPSPPLADIVRFGPSRITISLTVLKRIY